MKSLINRLLLIALAICAANGCSEDNGTAPASEGGVVIINGTFEDESDGRQSRVQFRITFDTLEEFREESRDGSLTRDITTAPASVSLKGRDEFLSEAAAALDLEPLRLRYTMRSDGMTNVAATMSVQMENGDRFTLNWNAQYKITAWLGQTPVPDDVAAATGMMRVAAIQGELRRSAICRNMVVNIRGMQPLIEGFEE